MPYLIGTDEAGYAPNLGPLVISASVWWVDEPSTSDNLYQRLKSVICKSLPRRADACRLAIADSKALYTPGRGLGALERGVLAALALVDHCPDDWSNIWHLLDPASLVNLSRLPWHEGYELRLPMAADLQDLTQLVPKLRRGFERAGVRLVALQSKAVFPEQFNQSNDDLGNKSETLSKITLGLIADVLTHCDGPALIVCDKHGGRNFYGRLLQQQFPDPLIEVCSEGAAQSIYRWGPPERRIEVRFRTGGEDFMPAALASMTSKYLRELAMRAFNDFWCTRVPELAPTAGYPIDAKRFRAAIQEAQLELGIADRVLWRDR